jgi:hypothetical protein
VHTFAQTSSRRSEYRSGSCRLALLRHCFLPENLEPDTAPIDEYEELAPFFRIQEEDILSLRARIRTLLPADRQFSLPHPMHEWAMAGADPSLMRTAQMASRGLTRPPAEPPAGSKGKRGGGGGKAAGSSQKRPHEDTKGARGSGAHKKGKGS